jgi:guanylate kinase
MTTIFIVVDHDRLLSRMRERGKDDEAEIARRMATAEAELKEAAKFDFVIESQTRDEDFAALLAILAQGAALAADEAHLDPRGRGAGGSAARSSL